MGAEGGLCALAEQEFRHYHPLDRAVYSQAIADAEEALAQLVVVQQLVLGSAETLSWPTC